MLSLFAVAQLLGYANNIVLFTIFVCFGFYVTRVLIHGLWPFITPVKKLKKKP